VTNGLSNRILECLITSACATVADFQNAGLHKSSQQPWSSDLFERVVHTYARLSKGFATNF